MNIRYHLSFVIFLFSFVMFLTCQKDPTALDNTKMELKAESVEVTEAWLRLSTDTISRNAAYVVKRDTHIVFEGTLQKPDTLLNDQNLEPLHTYTYTANRLVNNQPTGNRKQATITTMDTTSHHFEWQSWEFGGQGGSSYFNDVVIIDENDIWAVGKIYTENDKYNAAHWDGEKWELRKIKTNACGGVDYPPIKTVFSFTKNDILFGHIDASITKFNGATFVNDCSFIKQINGSINKIWGTSDNDLYIVGNSGLIAHYDGREWQRIPIETNMQLSDIWGGFNHKTGEKEILVIGTQILEGRDREIIRIRNNQAELLSSYPIQWTLYSIWFVPGKKYYIAGDDIHYKHNLSQPYWLTMDMSYFIFRIRGNNINDIIAVGGYGEVIHFNGVSWKSYYNEVGLQYGNYKSLDYKGKVVVVVGNTNRTANALLGRRK